MLNAAPAAPAAPPLLLLSIAIFLHQTWCPACPHQGHTLDSNSSKAESFFMCTTTQTRKTIYDAAKLATSRTSYTDHLLAPDSTSCLPTPRALHREQLIQGRGLFHVHNLRSRKMSLPNDSETNNELNFVLLYSHLLTHCLHKAWHLAFVLVWELLLG